VTNLVRRTGFVARFDIANYLASEDDMAEYLRQVIEDNDPVELADALGAIARARGMAQLAKDTGFRARACTRACPANARPAVKRCSRSSARWGSS
jgi:probable addiction module antidote protein